MWFKLFMALGEGGLGGAVGKEVSAVAAVNLPRYHFISPPPRPRPACPPRPPGSRGTSHATTSSVRPQCWMGGTAVSGHSMWTWHTVSGGHPGTLCQWDTLADFVRVTHWDTLSGRHTGTDTLAQLRICKAGAAFCISALTLSLGKTCICI